VRSIFFEVFEVTFLPLKIPPYALQMRRYTTKWNVIAGFWIPIFYNVA